MLVRRLTTEVSVSFLEAVQTRRLTFVLVINNPYTKQLPGYLRTSSRPETNAGNEADD